METKIIFKGLQKGKELKASTQFNPNDYSVVHQMNIYIEVDFDTTIKQAFNALVDSVNIREFEIVSVLTKTFNSSIFPQHVFYMLVSNIASMSNDLENPELLMIDYCNYQSKNFTDLFVSVEILFLLEKKINFQFETNF